MKAVLALAVASAGFPACCGLIVSKARIPSWAKEYALKGELGTSLDKVPPTSFQGTERDNLCIEGRLVPEFFLLGAQKAATTSFSVMMDAPAIVWATPASDEPSYWAKEAHIFDKEERFGLGKAFWASHYPKCSQTERLIAVDNTPNYLFTPEVPQRIAQFYGDSRARLQFMVILREPLIRIQSAFHFYSAHGWCKTHKLFKDYMRTLIEDPASDPCTFFSDTNYTWQLEGYSRYFQMSQFMIVPFLDLVAPINAFPGDVVLDVWANLGLDTSSASPPDLVHANNNNHAALEDELDFNTIKEYKRSLSQLISPHAIASIIVHHQPNLPTYSRGSRSTDQVANWIDQRW